MPLLVRVSAITVTVLSASSLVITGSLLMIASMSPLSIAATAPADVPTPMIETSFDVSPPLLSR